MTFFKKTIKTVPLEDCTVLVRVDYNVSLGSDGLPEDDFRIRASLPTIKLLLSIGCKVVIISHLGRPDGRDPRFSLEPIAARLAMLLGHEVRFVDEVVGDKVRLAIKRAPKRTVIVLENLRFDVREEANDNEFAKLLAQDSGARYFVQDGFGVVHRAHASTEAITHFLPSVAGLLLEREYTSITNAMKEPERPLVAVLGGAKVSDKIRLISRFVEIADTVIIGGAMANTFLSYKGYNVGKSKAETDQTETLDAIYEAAKRKVGADKVEEFIVLPTDAVVAGSLVPSEPRTIVSVNAVGKDDIIVDIGEASIDRMVNIIDESRTVVWNGTLGCAEYPNFAHGSARLALALATHPAIESIVGGGDTADFVLDWDARSGASFSHVSTGGGASLELMAGNRLPGVESLLDA